MKSQIIIHSLCTALCAYAVNDTMCGTNSYGSQLVTCSCDCLARALLSHVATALKPPSLSLVLARTLLSSPNATSLNAYATSLMPTLTLSSSREVVKSARRQGVKSSRNAFPGKPYCTF